MKVLAGTAMQADALPGTVFAQLGHLFVDKGKFKWIVRRRVACRFRVSCLQQQGKKKTHKTQTTILGPEDARLHDHLLLYSSTNGFIYCIFFLESQVLGHE